MTTFQRHVMACLFISLTGCDFFMGKDADAPTVQASAEASNAPSTAPASSAEAKREAAAPKVDTPKPIKTFALGQFKLPLSIDAPEDAKLEQAEAKDGLGGAIIDSSTVRVRVMRADARMASIAAAKATLQKLRVGAAQSFVKEEPDLLVYAQKGGRFSFVLLLKVGGVTYACDGGRDEPSAEALEPSIAGCRTIKKSS